MIFLFWVYESEPWLKPALSRAALRSAAHYGSGLAPEPGTPSANLSRAKPRPAEPRQHYRGYCSAHFSEAEAKISKDERGSIIGMFMLRATQRP